jgi:hypothetical protein
METGTPNPAHILDNKGCRSRRLASTTRRRWSKTVVTLAIEATQCIDAWQRNRVLRCVNRRLIDISTGLSITCVRRMNSRAA